MPLIIPLFLSSFEFLYGIMSANTIINGMTSVIIISSSNAVAIRDFLCPVWGLNSPFVYYQFTIYSRQLAVSAWYYHNKTKVKLLNAFKK